MHQSTWKETILPRFSKLVRSPTKSQTYDVIIVGGGVTGLMTAYFLTNEGKNVCVIEKDRLGMGNTGSSTAHLTSVTDLRLSDLARSYGDQGAYAVWNGCEVAVASLESIAKDSPIPCDFKRISGFLHLPLTSTNGGNDIESLQRDVAVAKRLGIRAEYVDNVPIVRRPGIHFPNQAKFHPIKFLKGIVDILVNRGCTIHEETEVTRIDADPASVHVGNIILRAQKVVVATHVPHSVHHRFLASTLFQTKIATYSTYVVGALEMRERLPEVCLWDTGKPYYYLRVDKAAHGNYVLLGGRDHKTGQAQDTKQCFRILSHMLSLVDEDLIPDHQWSGQIIETHDGLPFIGEREKNEFVATGFSGNGFTFGTLAAIMAADWVSGRENIWSALFSPQRLETHAKGPMQYVRENSDFLTYYIKDRLISHEALSMAKLENGDGGIFVMNGKQVACSRDADGNFFAVSAVCTHLGCLVHWNQAEQTWDCPCHGARFQRDGKVLAGPAETPLEIMAFSDKAKKAG